MLGGPAKSGVYCIAHAMSGKVYVGSAKDLRIRWRQHHAALQAGRHVNRHLQAAWHKYGAETFSFAVLAEVPPARLLVEEQRYIDMLQAADPRAGYNVHKLARNALGVKRSLETKARISRAKTGWKPPPKSLETRMRLSRALKGRVVGPMPAQQRQKISEALSGRPKSSQWRAAISARQVGREVSPETRVRIRAALLGRKMSTAARRKMSDARRGKPHPCAPRWTTYVYLECTECHSDFFRRAAFERRQAASRKDGPFCSLSCRNRVARRKRYADVVPRAKL